MILVLITKASTLNQLKTPEVMFNLGGGAEGAVVLGRSFCGLTFPLASVPPCPVSQVNG